MPKTTTPPTADELRQQAEKLDAQAHALRLEMQRQAQDTLDRRLAAQREWDEKFVAGFSRAEVEAEVDKAKAALDAALVADPLVRTLADYLTALRRRSHAVLEHMSALNRLGRETGPPNAGPTELATTDEYVIRTANRIAEDRIAAELAEMHAQREAAGDAATTTDNTKETT